MSSTSPYMAPKDDLDGAPRGSTWTCLSSFLVIGVGSIAGLVLGGSYGIREFNASVDNAVRQGLDADFIPVGIPLWGIVGAVIGSVVAGTLLSIWRGRNGKG